MPERFSRQILNHLSDQRYRPMSIRELADDLNIDDEDYHDFALAVEQLIGSGQALLGDSQTLTLPPPGREMTGTFRLHQRGFGFIMPDPDKRTSHGDLFVPAQHTNGAMTGDRVRAQIRHERGRAGGGRSPYVGRIIEIIKRGEQHYVGTVFQADGKWFVQVDGKVMSDPIVIRDPHASNAGEGDKVVVELVKYPSERYLAEGVITELLGEAGEPSVETVAVMRAFGLDEKFEESVKQAARDAAHSFDPDNIDDDRTDLTDLFIATIDPPDARDFDDAISLIELDPSTEKDGAAFELGVHIADVSHFVKPGTALDDEAAARGNSTYLPRKVIPMLPELLSNGVCSLQEGVKRYTKSAFMRYDETGKVVGERFANSVICSAKRLTYLEAQALIDKDLRTARKEAKTEPNYPRELMQLLQRMDQLAKIIHKRRQQQGMIELGLPEVNLIFSDTGHVIDAEPEDNAYTHRIIEMFMVEANEATARLFDRLNIPMIRRIHPDPSTYDMDELRRFARVAGYNIPSKPTRRELQQLLDSVRGKPAQHAVHIAVLRTLSKAEYAPMLLGHFALASEHYTHFTSPIRRYPDLVIHRALGAAIRAGATQGKVSKGVVRDLVNSPHCPDETRLAEISRHCSATERNSEAAERDLRAFLVLQLMEDFLGDDFEGTVTGVTSTGVFVQIDRYLVDGFIRMSDLPGSGVGRHGERWQFNRNDGSLVAQRSGRRITIGDRFTVRIAKVHAEARQLDLVILESPKRDESSKKKKVKRKPKTKQKAKSRKKTKTRRKGRDRGGW